MFIIKATVIASSLSIQVFQFQELVFENIILEQEEESDDDDQSYIAQLEKRISENGASSTLDLTFEPLADQRMTILVNTLRKNEVRITFYYQEFLR